MNIDQREISCFVRTWKKDFLSHMEKDIRTALSWGADPTRVATVRAVTLMWIGNLLEVLKERVELGQSLEDACLLLEKELLYIGEEDSDNLSIRIFADEY